MSRTVIVSPDDEVVVRVPLSPAERGLMGARKRWDNTPRKVVRLDSLTPAQRRLVLALVDAVRAAPDAQPSGQS